MRKDSISSFSKVIRSDTLEIKVQGEIIVEVPTRALANILTKNLEYQLRREQRNSDVVIEITTRYRYLTDASEILQRGSNPQRCGGFDRVIGPRTRHD